MNFVHIVLACGGRVRAALYNGTRRMVRCIWSGAGIIIRSPKTWIAVLVAATLVSLGVVWTLSRIETAFVQGDWQWQHYQSPTEWRVIGDDPHAFIAQKLGLTDAYLYRQALSDLREKNVASAVEKLNTVSGSDDARLASQAHTLLGILIAHVGIANHKEELLQQAVDHFGKAVWLDANNEDAKYDLELLLATADKLGAKVSKPKPDDTKKENKEPSPQAPGVGYTPPSAGY